MWPPHIGLGQVVQPCSQPPVAAVGCDRVLSEPLFTDALVRERRRADRFEKPFAVLVVDRGDVPPASGYSWLPILGAMGLVKRDIDVLGWLERDAVLGLLLADVDRPSALAALDRLRHEMSTRLVDRAAIPLSMRLYAHGDASSVGAPDVLPVDLLLDAFVQQPGHAWRDAVKRALDIVGSAMLLAVLAPVFLAVFFAVKCTSPGPALFRQPRVGRQGKLFTILKFRTMYVNAGHAIHQEYVTWFIKHSGQQPRTGHEVFKLTKDARITPVGRFLRKSSLDELPQFWNVLRGEMSLVGPRPPLPFEIEQYQPWHRRRVLETKPGITGPWQVSGRSRTTFDEMVRLDLRYARTHTLWTDIKILAATPAAVISGKGAC